MTDKLNPREHGAVPFWFWNGEQQESEITRQLELTAAGGFKGLAIHARTGNRTEYMSARWLALVRHSCEEALRLGLEIWLYDEEGFPSGTVGHRLQKDDPAYQQKLLRFEYVRGSQISEVEDLVAIYDAVSYQRIQPAAVFSDQEVLAFWMAHLPRYIDALKRETAERFIEMTHEVYFKALGEYIGAPITTIYTDDLNSYLDRGVSLPWTEALPVIFESSRGYSLLDKLPALVENVPGFERARLDYRSVVQDLFLNQFVDPMYQWCEEHGVRFTGHLSGDEGDITKAIQRFGSAMSFYEYEHIPGIDDFLCSVSSGCHLDQVRNSQGHCPVVLFKQASSVANQLKGGACSCEVLTFLGWGASLWGQAAYLNYELTLGVNLMVHHAFSYATGGVAKRDCPPSYFCQQPYWPEYRRFHDAVARSTQLLTRGMYDADTLVLHPLSSCWISMDGDRCSIGHSFETRAEDVLPDPLALEESLAEISHELLRLRVGFEYGDEWLLAKHGEVCGSVLQVGDMHYKTVIVPEISNLLASTVDLLEHFQAVGGRVIAVKPSDNCLVDGKEPEKSVFGAGDKGSTPNIQHLTSNAQVESRGARLYPEVIDGPGMFAALGLEAGLALEVEEPGAPVTCHTRDVDGVREHFVYNVSDRPQVIRWAGELQAYDPIEDSGIEVTDASLRLPPFHAVHLLPELPTGTASKPLVETLFALEPLGESLSVSALDWQLSLEQQNLMLIDWCELPDGRTVYYDDGDPKPRGECECRVTVEIPVPADVTGLVGEARTLSGMRINGKPLPQPSGKHPSSQDMLVVDLAGMVQSGSNEITFTGPDAYALFEPFYLMGDFGVELVATDGGMRPKLGELRPGLGELVEQGMPFAWGGVLYETEIAGDCGTDWLDCGDVDGVVVLLVNGKEAGCRYMAPYRFRIAELLEPGKNSIQLRLYNTAQNLYGPHRRIQGVALHEPERRGRGRDPYYLERFGVSGPVVVEGVT